MSISLADKSPLSTSITPCVPNQTKPSRRAIVKEIEVDQIRSVLIKTIVYIYIYIYNSVG